MRRLTLLVGVAALAVGPWVGSTATPGIVMPLASYTSPMFGTPANAAVDGPPDSQARRRAARPSGCTCREVVVNAENAVRNAEVETGDAEVVNRSVTYIAPSFSDNEVEVDQEADARSGDAVAGQIVDVDAGEGCSRVHVKARNLVEDAEVRSGDAIAGNESTVLIDPRLDRGDLEIEVDQEANAKSGRAIAGQIIKVRGGGGPCGGVIVEALNRLREVELETGEAETFNASDILTCESEGCIDDIRELLEDVDTVQVCSENRCEDVDVADFVEELEERAKPEDDDDADDDDDDADEDDEDDDEDEEDPEEDEAAEESAPRARAKGKSHGPGGRPDPALEPATDTAVQPSPEPTPESAPAQSAS